MVLSFYNYSERSQPVEPEATLFADTVIPCDYCDAPAIGMVSTGELSGRRFRCGHEDHKWFARLNVRRMPARPRYAYFGHNAVMAVLRNQYIRLRLGPNWLSVAAKRARLAKHEKESG